jgi:hypothetical protein
MKHTQALFTPTSTPLGAVDVITMASLLVGKHGKYAIDVAGFMAREQAAYKDHVRQQAWHAVISVANDMLSGKMLLHKLMIH